MISILAISLSGALAPAAAAPTRQSDESTSWVVRAETVYTVSGAPIERGGTVVVEDGIIAAVAPGSRGGDDGLECFAVTPGFVDLSVRIDNGWRSVEESSESVPAMRIVDALDLFDFRWARQARSGVTTALACAPDNDVIGGVGVVLKTAGVPTLAARLVKADAVLRGSTGTQPSRSSRGNRFAGPRPRDHFTRRPTTRMSVEWLLRKTFYDALAAREDPERAFPGTEELEAVLRGDMPLALQAWATQDIRTAIYLKEEFGIPRLIIDAAAEAWREPELLVRSGAAVVLPPMTFAGRGRDDSFFAWHTAKLMDELGVPFAFSGHGNARPDARFAAQPGHAMRGGLPFDAALEAATLAPARMVGVDDRVGSLEVGKDADLVLWSGQPFQPSSRVVGVLVGGRLILDPREETP